ncbi:MAG: hypothetical protein AUJ49_05595 [Desulfovibrionaceae bacterium CG1_02_65_16]|nr:MAG: hypothetical protein AUJ49_05595 [Desulfovibrionaceae bacterium CG1_02_65_16]
MTFKTPVDETDRAALCVLVAAVRREPGCLEYHAHLHAEDTTRVLFYERWENQAALDIHGKSAALTGFRAAMADRFVGPSELNFWRRLV